MDDRTVTTSFAEYYGLRSASPCHADSDGDCSWKDCPQLRDREPHATGRHCPLDKDMGQ